MSILVDRHYTVSSQRRKWIAVSPAPKVAALDELQEQFQRLANVTIRFVEQLLFLICYFRCLRSLDTSLISNSFPFFSGRALSEEELERPIDGFLELAEDELRELTQEYSPRSSSLFL